MLDSILFTITFVWYLIVGVAVSIKAIVAATIESFKNRSSRSRVTHTKKTFEDEGEEQ